MDPAAVGGADGVGFCCPSCRGALASDPAGYHCRACQRRYPIVWGIPDFRLLVCCSAEALPFPDGTFDAAIGLHVLEHAADPQVILSETVRTLKANGWCYFSTPNRFSLGPEPSVRVWGVGFVPRSFASRYVRLLKGIPYRNIRLLSCFEVRRMVVRAGLRTWSMSPPRLAECEQRTLSGPARRIVRLYHLLREVPVFRHLLLAAGPFLQVVGRKRA